MVSPNITMLMQTIQTTEAPSQVGFEEDLRAGLAKRLRVSLPTPRAEGVRQGLGLETLDEVQAFLGLKLEALEHMLHVSARTLQRRRKSHQRLTPAESDRLWRLLYIVEQALKTFEDQEAARSWLTTPKALLGGETPLERLDTEPGLREIEDMLTVIDETAAA